jgi:hypothetical protein
LIPFVNHHGSQKGVATLRENRAISKNQLRSRPADRPVFLGRIEIVLLATLKSTQIDHADKL